MCSKSRNEDKDNIDQDIDVCAMGVQTIMQSDHGTLRNQNKLKILRLILIPSVRDSSRIAVEILKFDRKKENRLRPRPHVSGYFWIRNFFFPDTAIVHTHTVNSQANPEIFESALQSGNFWIR